jgi:hypothetical protein
MFSRSFTTLGAPQRSWVSWRESSREAPTTTYNFNLLAIGATGGIQMNRNILDIYDGPYLKQQSVELDTTESEASRRGERCL